MLPPLEHAAVVHAVVGYVCEHAVVVHAVVVHAVVVHAVVVHAVVGCVCDDPLWDIVWMAEGGLVCVSMQWGWQK